MTLESERNISAEMWIEQKYNDYFLWVRKLPPVLQGLRMQAGFLLAP